MRSFRKNVVIILLVLAAVITPSTDPFNMAVVFVQLCVLYEPGNHDLIAPCAHAADRA